MNEERKVALVVGGTGGIGRAVACQLYGNGYEVILAARTEESLRDTAQATGGRYVVMDVTDSSTVASVFEELFSDGLRLDLMVNAAGAPSRMRPILRMKLEDWDAEAAIHGRGCFACGQNALKVMRRYKSGTIINIASIAAQSPVVPGYSAYGAAKASMVNFTKSLNREGIRQGVRATAILPNYVDTALWEGQEMEPDQLMSPEVIAQTVLYIANLPANVVIDEIVLDTVNARA